MPSPLTSSSPTPPEGSVLTARALNRALLARQWLLERQDHSALEAVEHLVGLQAQDVKAPYYQLWARLNDFDPHELSGLLESRAAVRIVLMRGTIHLVSARDALLLRPVVQELIARATDANWGRGVEGVDRAALASAGRALVEDQPRTFAQLGALLAERWPDADPASLAQQIRALVPLVQVPPRALWGRGGAAAHTSAEHWLPGVDVPEPSREDVVRRYLRAFGPASVADAQKWSGLTRLAETVERLRGELVSFSDERGRELLDVVDAPRPDPETEVPPRLAGPFDNLILSHADARVLPVELRRLVMTQNGLIAGMVLIDGFVAGSWRVKATKKLATLTFSSFSGKAYRRKDAAVLREEGDRLLRFAAPEAPARDVVFSE
jgi:hypothetical protein